MQVGRGRRRRPCRRRRCRRWRAQRSARELRAQRGLLFGHRVGVVDHEQQVGLVTARALASMQTPVRCTLLRDRDSGSGVGRGLLRRLPRSRGHVPLVPEPVEPSACHWLRRLCRTSRPICGVMTRVFFAAGVMAAFGRMLLRKRTLVPAAAERRAESHEIATRNARERPFRAFARRCIREFPSASTPRARLASTLGPASCCERIRSDAPTISHANRLRSDFAACDAATKLAITRRGQRSLRSGAAARRHAHGWAATFSASLGAVVACPVRGTVGVARARQHADVRLRVTEHRLVDGVGPFLGRLRESHFARGIPVEHLPVARDAVTGIADVRLRDVRGDVRARRELPGFARAYELDADARRAAWPPR